MIDVVARLLVRGEIVLLAMVYAYFVLTDGVPLIAFVLIALVWLARWRVTGALTRRTLFDVPILLLLVWLPVSFSVTIDPALSLPKVYGVLLSVAFFYAIVNAIRTRDDLATATVWLVVVCAGIALAGSIGTDWAQDKIVSASFIYDRLPRVIQGIPRSIAGGFARNGVGGTLAFTIPLLAALLVTGDQRPVTEAQWPIVFSIANRKSKIANLLLRPSSLVWLALALSLVTLALTQSRGGMLGTLVGLVVVAVWRERRVAWLIGAGAWGLLALVALGYGNALLEFVLRMDARNATLASRWEVWQRGMMMVRDFPYTGIGIGTYNTIAHLLYPFFIAAPDEVVPHAHNQFLQVAVDVGIPGLLAYLGLLGAFGISIGRAIATPTPTGGDGLTRALSIGLAAGMLAHHVFGLTDAFMLGTKPGIVMWAFFAFAAVLDGRQRTDDEQRTTEHSIADCRLPIADNPVNRKSKIENRKSLVLRPLSSPWFRVTVGTLVSVVFLFLAFKDVPLDAVGQIFARLNYFWVVVAILAMQAQSALRAWRWIRLYYPTHRDLRLAPMFGIVVISQMLNIVVPWRVGEIARVYLAREIARKSAAQTIATLAVEKIFDTLMMFALLLLIPLFMTLPDWLEGPREGFIWMAGGLVLLAVVIVLSSEKLINLLGKIPLPWGKQFISTQARIALSSLEAFKRWDLHLALQVLSVAIWLLGVLGNYLVFLAMDLRLPFISAFLLLAVLQIGGLVPSAPGKVGVFQVLCIWTLALFAVDKSIGLAYGILLYLIAYGTPIVLGILFLWWGGISLRTMTNGSMSQ